MFRCVFSVLRTVRPLTTPYYKAARIICNVNRSYVAIKNIQNLTPSCSTLPTRTLLNIKQILDISSNITPITVRNVTKFSLNKGKRKSSKSVVKRFFRLHWGGWIRTKVGRQKRLWKKSSSQKRRLREHVFCTGTQSKLLDKMVTKFWKRPKYYVDDPYAPYHTREEYAMTRKKPVVRN